MEDSVRGEEMDEFAGLAQTTSTTEHDNETQGDSGVAREPTGLPASAATRAPSLLHAARSNEEKRFLSWQERAEKRLIEPIKERGNQMLLSSGAAASNGWKDQDIVRVEELLGVSRALREDNSSLGTPTCLAMHSKYAVIGTSKGVILVFDHFGAFLGCMGGVSLNANATSLRHWRPSREAVDSLGVTCLDVIGNSDLIAGYGDGRILYWDAISRTLLKTAEPSSAESEEPASIVAARWHRPGHAVTVDSKGSLYLLRFTKSAGVVFLISTGYTVERRLLLLEPSGVLDFSCFPVPIITKPSGTTAALGSVLAVSTSSVTLIVRIGENSRGEAHPSILHRWSAPPMSDADSVMIAPCTSFLRLSSPNSSTEQWMIIRGWGRQLDVARVVHESNNEAKYQIEHTCACPEEIISVQWLSETMICYVNTLYQCVVQDLSRWPVETARVDVSRVQLVRGLKFSTQHSIRTTIPYEEPSVTSSANQRPQQLLRSTPQRMYLLGEHELVYVQMEPWHQRIDRLAWGGDWLEAMCVALGYFKAVVRPLLQSSHERAVQLHSGDYELVGNSHSNFDYRSDHSLARDVSKIAQLPKDYIAACWKAPRDVDEATCSVCLEYAIGCDRMDLFESVVYERCSALGKLDVFADTLVSYLQASRVSKLLPTTIHALVTNLAARGLLEDLESVVLLVDLREGADIDGLIRVCREHRLYPGLCRVYNVGLEEFNAPAREMLKVLAAQQDTEVASTLFLYLKYCFLGMSFPRAEISSAQALTASPRVANGLLELMLIEKPNGKALVELIPFESWCELLIRLDVDATLDVLSTAMDSPARPASSHSNGAYLDALFRAAVAFGNPGAGPADGGALPKSLDFCVKYFVRGRSVSPNSTALPAPGVVVSSALLQEMLSRLITLAILSDESLPEDDGTPLSRLIAVLERLTLEDELSVDALADRVVGHSKLSRAATLILIKRAERFVADPASCPSSEDLTNAFVAVIDSITPGDSTVFGFLAENAGHPGERTASAVREACLRRARTLLASDKTRGAQLLLRCFNGDVEALLDKLGADSERCDVLEVYVGGLAVGNEGISTELCKRFVGLLCAETPERVYEWLRANEGKYPLDEALSICRAHGIADATAHLLEITGRIDEALDLVLSELVMSSVRARRAGEAGKDRVLAGAMVAIQLCERNSDLVTEDSAAETWFRVLDVLIDAFDAKEQALADEIVRLTLSHMLRYVKHARVLAHVTSEFRDEKLGRFELAVGATIAAFATEERVWSCAVRLARNDYVNVASRARRGLSRGVKLSPETLALRRKKESRARVLAAETAEEAEERATHARDDLLWEQLGARQAIAPLRFLEGTPFEIDARPNSWGAHGSDDADQLKRDLFSSDAF